MDATSANTATLIQAWWPIILSSIFYTAWCVRLEAKVLYLQQDRKESTERAQRTETVLWAKLDAMQLAMVEMVREVAKLQGMIENKRNN